MKEIKEERRSYHRGDLSFQVNFRVMAPDEGRLRAMTGNGVSFGGEKNLKVNAASADSKEQETPLNNDLIDFLILIDEKLDQILSTLADNSSPDRSLKECRGVDISATGMGIITSHSVKAGQIIEAKIELSRFPLVSMDVVGEIVQVARVIEYDQSLLRAGIRFLNLDTQSKEKIIKCVFQSERASIREMKRMEDEEEAIPATDSSE